MKKILLLLIALHTILLASTPNQCDVLASDPLDPQKPIGIEGVDYSEMNSSKAIKACKKAIKDFPNELRYRYQLGRAFFANANKNRDKDVQLYLDERLVSSALFAITAKKGYSMAQLTMGNNYSFLGNDKEAFRNYMKSAKQDNKEAQCNIGLMYYFGRGTTKNYKKAFKWLKISAENGDKEAQYSIGVIYENGHGVKKSYIHAYAWYNLASANGYDASKALGIIETKMTKNQIAIGQEYNPLETQKKSKVQDTIGTAFFVSKSTVLTNNHVIHGCKEIELIRKGYKSIATVIAKDVNNDLAILKANTKNSNFLKFRTGKGIRIGNEIVVLGYPFGNVLGTSIKLTTGNISSLTGLVDDTTRLQMSAPVQPGSSGGPLLDTSGNIIGVVYAKLAKRFSAENVNLAIKANVALTFLDINNVDYAVEQSNDVKDLADIADEAKESVVQVICYQ